MRMIKECFFPIVFAKRVPTFFCIFKKINKILCGRNSEHFVHPCCGTAAFVKQFLFLFDSQPIKLRNGHNGLKDKPEATTLKKNQQFLTKINRVAAVNHKS